MNGVLERTLGILELLSQHGGGLELAAIADQLDIPRSAVQLSSFHVPPLTCSAQSSAPPALFGSPELQEVYAMARPLAHDQLPSVK